VSALITLSLQTSQREELRDVTAEVAQAVRDVGLRDGAVLVYVPHTTAGVTINENADPSVRRDVVMALRRLVPPDLPFTHLEGNSDAHVKASLMGSSCVVPVREGRLELGTWQGIYFAEFDGPRRRRLLVQPLLGAAPADPQAS
jgi:secondary thiamine-phosphate synthase enzyme